MTRIKGQDVAAQNQRLANGCCPVHGHKLMVVTKYVDGVFVTSRECPRERCTETFEEYKQQKERAND